MLALTSLLLAALQLNSKWNLIIIFSAQNQDTDKSRHMGPFAWDAIDFYYR